MENKLTKYITIGLTDDPDKVGIFISPEIDASTAFRLIGTLSLHVLNAYAGIAISSIKQNFNSGATSKASKLNTNAELNAAISGIKESMYDAMDSVFSNVLTTFYPEAPKNTLEDEAILELTNKKIEERYEQLSDKEKAAFQSTYKNILDKLKEDKDAANTEDTQTDKE